MLRFHRWTAVPRPPVRHFIIQRLTLSTLSTRLAIPQSVDFLGLHYVHSTWLSEGQRGSERAA
jgi:hypothetical protein